MREDNALHERKTRSLAEEFIRFAGSLSESDIDTGRAAFHDQLRKLDDSASLCTQGFVREFRQVFLDRTNALFRESAIISHGRNKPHGYSGDFEIIDLTYLQAEPSHTARGRMWDRFYHRQIAPIAVRARKDLFGMELARLARTIPDRPLAVLNIGSGPAREILDGASGAGLDARDLTVECVETDANAIRYATALLGARWEGSVAFVHRNALRYRPKRKFDLVWSAGLFDYLDDRLAVHLLRNMWAATRTGGRLVIGNFAVGHPTRPWIEWCGDWFLIHRTSKDLFRIAMQAGITGESTHVKTHVDQFEAILYLTADKYPNTGSIAGMRQGDE